MANQWSITKLSGSVCRLEYGTKPLWAYISSDWHWDSLKCNRDLLQADLSLAKKIGAPVLAFGDVFDAMGGKQPFTPVASPIASPPASPAPKASAPISSRMMSVEMPICWRAMMRPIRPPLAGTMRTRWGHRPVGRRQPLAPRWRGHRCIWPPTSGFGHRLKRGPHHA